MVVTLDYVIESQAFALGASAQKAELIAFMTSLVLSQRKKFNIYMDSKHAFMVTLAHGAM